MTTPKKVMQEWKIANHERKRTKTTVETQQTRPWSDLPGDIIGELMAGLSSTDQIRLGVTCRSYLSKYLTPQHKDKDNNVVGTNKLLPWFVKYDIDNYLSLVFKPKIVCELFNPIRIQKDILSPYYDACTISTSVGLVPPYCSMKVLACKHGFMFFTYWSKAKSTCLTKEKAYFVLFSPFTKQILPLPDLDYHCVSTYINKEPDCNLGTFSSHPSSPHCVYFVLRQYRGYGNQVIISTLHQGDRDWTTHEFKLGGTYYPPFESVVYYEGCFYFITKYGNLGSYDVAMHDWEIVTQYRYHVVFGIQSLDNHLLVHDGQLLWARVERTYDEEEKCSVFVFSRSTGSWIEQTSLGDYALFLGCTSFSVSAATADSSRTRDIADKIYYYKPIGNKIECRCYFLKVGKFVDSSFYSISWPGNSQSGIIWIQPPHIARPLNISADLVLE